MTLISFLVTLVIIGVIYYLVDRFIPLPEVIKVILQIVLVLVVITLFLSLLGIALPFRIK